MTQHKLQGGKDQGDAGPSVDSTPAALVEARQPTCATLELSRWVATKLEDRSMRASPGRVLSDAQLPLLVEPLTTRIRAGALDQTNSAVLTLACGIVDGGLPLELFLRDPLIDLSMADRRRFATNSWLPPHLRERATVLPDTEGGSPEFDCQHFRIIAAIQKGLRDTNPEIPVFFLGSAASLRQKPVTDIDIGTSNALRQSFANPSDEIFRNDFDRFSSEVRKNFREGKPVIGRPTHVGAIWEYMPLALGISVLRYERALRITPSEVFVIESRDRSQS
jgi:hypothetical protein